MPKEKLSTPTVLIGSVAASATVGALIAMGRRLGSAAIPFASIGAALFRETPSSSAAGLVIAGLVLHVTSVLLWTALFVWLVRVVRWRTDAAAMAIGAGAYVLAWILAWWSGAGLASVLPMGDRLVLSVILAAALVVGMRFAFLTSQSA